MSETTIYVSEQIGLLLAEHFGASDAGPTQLWPYEIGPMPLSDSFFDEGDGD